MSNLQTHTDKMGRASLVIESGSETESDMSLSSDMEVVSPEPLPNEPSPTANDGRLVEAQAQAPGQGVGVGEEEAEAQNPHLARTGYNLRGQRSTADGLSPYLAPWQRNGHKPHSTTPGNTGVVKKRGGRRKAAGAANGKSTQPSNSKRAYNKQARAQAGGRALPLRTLATTNTSKYRAHSYTKKDYGAPAHFFPSLGAKGPPSGSDELDSKVAATTMDQTREPSPASTNPETDTDSNYEPQPAEPAHSGIDLLLAAAALLDQQQSLTTTLCLSSQCPLHSIVGHHTQGVYLHAGGAATVPNSELANRYYAPSVPPPAVVEAFNCALPTLDQIYMQEGFHKCHTTPCRKNTGDKYQLQL